MIHSVSSALEFIPIRFSRFKKNNAFRGIVKNLSQAKLNHEYVIENVISDDENTTNFLFTLGCFAGESITLISVLSDTYVVSIKDARYSLDVELAKSIELVSSL